MKKRLFLMISLSVSTPLFACQAPEPSSSCRMNIEIGAVEELSTSTGDVTARGLRINGSIEGYSLGTRGSKNSFSVIDDDGAVTLTAVYNVLATDNVLQRNKDAEVVLDNNSLKLMRQAVDLGLSYMDALPEDQRSPGRRQAYENLKAALASVGPANRIPKGFLNDKLGGILRRTNQTNDQVSEGQEFASYRTVLSTGALGATQQLCVNPRSGLRCGPGYLVSGLGTNFCTRKFDTGEVYPTSQCPEGVRYQFGPAFAPSPSSETSSSRVGNE